MRHSKLTAPEATVLQNNEELVVVFQNFNGVFLAKITNSKDRETYAYGGTKDSAKENAISNYNTKYNNSCYSLYPEN
ncbi:hypothetical protein [Chryseobacterium vrystaatense]|uniref:KTSC domain-containing protein n=1 Tax=Chryseobacterium vrystaatense TaxID=307480 RepID=A0ABR4UPB9_9FLAO|nr:hypothetical protein [Chryseobacterium vrystaatense]KFF26856.1 hypothetical protein IW16_06140 [Chryseobacterium vrystaatense]